MSIKERPDLEEIAYPDSDGQPMADNTLQFEWIHTLKYGFEYLYRNDPDVFVAGDLLWYPVEGDPACRCAPDVLIVFGRPKGYRGSYMQWKEGGIAPQVVMEVLSPGNRLDEMIRKFRFYEQHAVEEYYVYDPDPRELYGWIRTDGKLVDVPTSPDWTSPRLGVRFEVGREGLKVFGSDGAPFKSYLELAGDRDAERQRANQLAAKLRELGVDPDAL